MSPRTWQMFLAHLYYVVSLTLSCYCAQLSKHLVEDARCTQTFTHDLSVALRKFSQISVALLSHM